MRLIENGGVEWKGQEKDQSKVKLKKGIKGREIREKSLSISALTWHAIKTKLWLLW